MRIARTPNAIFCILHLLIGFMQHRFPFPFIFIAAFNIEKYFRFFLPGLNGDVDDNPSAES